MPAASEIARLIVDEIEETAGVRHIVIHDRKMGLTRISDLHSSFMAMQYLVLFLYGDNGYRLCVPLQYENNELENKRKDVTIMEYAAFRIQQCMKEGHALIHAGNLFQTYIVDMYTCIEEDQDQHFWVKKNQTKIRAELYCGIKDVVFRGDTEGSQVRKRIVLPSRFIGGPRYMSQNYQDAIALCHVLGNPDILVTFTSNPKWPEIKAALDEIAGQPACERPDIIARDFKIKLDEMMNDFQKQNHFGKIIAA